MDHPFGIWSLIPPVLAIALAIATRRIILSLVLGIVSGTGMLAWKDHTSIGQFFQNWTEWTAERHFWNNLVNADHLRIFVFTTLMSCMVMVMFRSGSMRALVNLLLPIAKGRKSTQVLTWLLGMVVFFDDYANTLLLGNSMRPLTDRWRISREKLAYLVDSTAAPVAGLAVISTWVATEIKYISSGFDAVQVEAEGLRVFVETIPYRFYVLWTLIFVPLTALLGREFGPMWNAEKRAMRSVPEQTESSKKDTNDSTAGWYNAILPILVVIGVTIWLLIVTGQRELLKEGVTDARWLDVIGNGNSYLALTYASLLGLASVTLLVLVQGKSDLADLKESIEQGVAHMLPAFGILLCAWTLSELTSGDYLDTAGYLGNLLNQSISAAWMPTIVFLLASCVAFSTGTSWGTMGILIPLVIPATHGVLPPEEVASNPIMLATIGSVLAGAIFGDHCSPISDTTVLSSQASECDHVAHVRTQMPYALLVGLVSVVCGTIPVGFGVPVAVPLVIGTVVLIAMLRFIGKPLDNV